jgi:hypothetical protein
MTDTHKRQTARGNSAGFSAFLLCAVLLTAVFTAAVFGQTAADFAYKKENDGVTITRYTGSAKTVVIPGLLEGLPVTTIGTEAFSGSQLTGVTIPGSVTNIKGGAFSENQLTGVIIPPGVTRIGAEAFYSNQLTSVTIPDSVTIIKGGAFCRNQLTAVTIPDSVTSIEFYTFTENQLISVTIGAQVAIDEQSFDGEFTAVYNNGGKKAGRYTRSGAIWRYAGDR